MLKLTLGICLLTMSFVSFGQSLATLLAKSDQELFDMAKTGNIGKCRIYDARTAGHACDFYAKTDKVFAGASYNGLPGKSGIPYGSGCMVSPDIGPKFNNTCWGSPNTYPSYSSTQYPICTGSYVKNGANMMRNALLDPADYCELNTIVVTPPAPAGPGKRLSKLVQEGKVKFNVNNNKDCRLEASTSVLFNGQNVFPLTKLPETLCMRLLRSYKNQYGTAATVPTAVMRTVASAVGELTPTQFFALRDAAEMRTNNLDLVQQLQVSSTTTEAEILQQASSISSSFTTPTYNFSREDLSQYLSADQLPQLNVN